MSVSRIWWTEGSAGQESAVEAGAEEFHVAYGSRWVLNQVLSEQKRGSKVGCTLTMLACAEEIAMRKRVVEWKLSVARTAVLAWRILWIHYILARYPTANHHNKYLVKHRLVFGSCAAGARMRRRAVGCSLNIGGSDLLGRRLPRFTGPPRRRVRGRGRRQRGGVPVCDDFSCPRR